MIPQPTSTTRQATDRGLSGLGLIMQLVGGLMTAIATGYLAIFLIALLEGAGGRGGGGPMFWLLAVLLASVARSAAHMGAGNRLLYEGDGTPASALGRYLALAAVQIGVVCLVLLVNDVPPKWLLFVILVLGAWPAALAIVARPMLEELGGDTPMADDGGLDGAIILLLVLGAVGVGIGVIMLLGWLELPAPAKSKLIGLSLLAAVGLLSFRSILHLRAGVTGTSTEDVGEIFAAAERYANVGISAGLIAAGLMVITVLNEMPSAPPMATIMMLVMGGMVAWMLAVWPAAIRRFVRHRQIAALDARRPLRARSADRGLPALGWLLLALGVYALATSLTAALLGGSPDPDDRRNPLAALGGLLGSEGRGSVWISVAVAALQTWAGTELIRMGERYRQAGMAYGIAATCAALYAYLPVLGQLTKQSAAVVANPLGIAAFASVATSLVIPVATLFLVQRKLVDPDAVVNTFT